MTKQPSSDDVMMYGCLVGESGREAQGMLSPAVDADASEPCVMVGADESAGKEQALVAGCNANNGMASARTANCNNAVSNDNSNYAGALAVNQVEDSRKHLTSRPTRSNIANDHTATAGYGLGVCALPPFCGDIDADDAIGNGVKPIEATHE